MTPDITVRGLSPTPGEYEASLRLLREIAAKGLAGLSALRATTLEGDEYEAWIAIARCGLVRSRADGAWDVVTLTSLGERYLAERSG